ncbi:MULTISPECIES: class F sortase [Amycolatopsis]|uniref:class F sortase n=1 Tax=Amycolatopsis TaxID=1813 RepID=UPI000B8A9FBC|nr:MULTISPECIES: class F sortase [Amycolatopsis]OXM72371.1 class F sortase [Amycolatopsis sp. KNN50.9b]
MVAVRVFVALLGLLLLGGCAAQQAPVPVPPGVTTAETTAEAAAPVEPELVDIPRIGARSTLVPLGLNADDTIEVPPVTQPMQAGWYRHGPAPGEAGPAVILGHVDGGGQKGIFHRLKELAPGDEVAVSRKDGSVVRFAVSRVEQIDKDEFPTEAVYGDTAGPELRLITCGGSFDRAAHSYRDNIIVFAVLR